MICQGGLRGPIPGLPSPQTSDATLVGLGGGVGIRRLQAGVAATRVWLRGDFLLPPTAFMAALPPLHCALTRKTYRGVVIRNKVSNPWRSAPEPDPVNPPRGIVARCSSRKRDVSRTFRAGLCLRHVWGLREPIVGSGTPTAGAATA